MYKTCTRSGIPYDEGFLVRCFMHGLDSNFDYTREMIDVGVLKYYELSLNEVLVRVNDIKLNKTSNGTWVTTSANANATSGQQGARRPSPTPDSTQLESSNENSTSSPTSNIPSYLTKPSELSFREVKMLLERYSCPLCRRNTHAMHDCFALKTAYNISLKTQSSNSNDNGSAQSNPSVAHPPPVAANRVSASVTVLPDEPERYDGFESVSVPPPSSDDEHNTDATTVSAVTASMNVSKLNESSTSYSPSLFHFYHHVGSVRQANICLPRTACLRISSTVDNDYPIIIDSGATHHMWSDPNAFISLRRMKNCYVTLANNYKVPITGQGVIQINIQGFILHIHGVYLVPSLQYCLYSVKQHRRYLRCSCIFDNHNNRL